MKGAGGVEGTAYEFSEALLSVPRGAARDHVEMEISVVPERLRKLYVRAVTGGRCSPRDRIKLMCAQCVGYEDYRRAIPSCRDRTCPLWEERPYQ